MSEQKGVMNLSERQQRIDEIKQSLQLLLAPEGKTVEMFVLPFLEGLCRQYGYDFSDSVVLHNLLLLFLIEIKGKWPHNDKLFADSVIIHSESLPTAESSLSCLYGWYQTPRSNQEISEHKASQQAARPAMGLRNLGFMFAADEDGNTKDSAWFWKDASGMPYRMIIGYEEPSNVWGASWNKLPKHFRAVLRQFFFARFLGRALYYARGSDRP